MKLNYLKLIPIESGTSCLRGQVFCGVQINKIDVALTSEKLFASIPASYRGDGKSPKKMKPPELPAASAESTFHRESVRARSQDQKRRWQTTLACGDNCRAHILRTEHRFTGTRDVLLSIQAMGESSEKTHSRARMYDEKGFFCLQLA